MRPTRVILILNYPPDRQQSMLRFGDALARALGDAGAQVSKWTCPQLFAGAVRSGRFGSLTKWLAYIDKFALGFVALVWHRLLHPGAVWHIVDHGNALYAFALPRSRVLVTCHDCIAIEEAFSGRTGEHVGRFGKLLQTGIVKGLEWSARVAAVSQATLQDLRRLTAVSPDRLVVIHNGLLSNYRRLPQNEALALLQNSAIPCDQPFVFMIGSNLKRKNRPGAIASFEQLRRLLPGRRYRLVMAGEPWSDDIRGLAQQCEFSPDIVETGPITDEVLEAAYSAAALVSFPSLAEGFGLPVIEAQACGALVVTSDIAPLPEVGGDGALYADPTSPSQYAAALRDALALGESLRQRGVLNADRFSAKKWAASYIEAYRQLTGSGA